MLPRFEHLTSRWLGCLSLVLCLVQSNLIAADPPLLFEDAPNVPSLNASAAFVPNAKRSRLVRLGDSMRIEPGRATNPGKRVQVNLFPDASFAVDIDRQHATRFGGLTIHGVTSAPSPGDALFVIQNGVMAGVVHVPDVGVFKVEHVRDGLHRVVEVDPSRWARCGVDLLGSGPGGLMENDDSPAAKSQPDTTTSEGTGLLPGSPGISSETPAVVDLMIVYTDDAREGAGGRDGMETLAQLAVEEANQVFANSEIHMELNLVNIRQINYTETGDIARDVQNLQNGSITGLDDLRKIQYKADLVSMITEREDTGTIAGIAFVLRNLSADNRDFSAFSVVRRAYAVGDYVFVHEIGHNLGCAHDRDNSAPPPNGGAFPYSYGERFVAQGVTYATVMTYPPGVRIPYFSNPNLSYLGTPIGVSSNSALGTDNAATINYTGENVVSDFLTAARRYSFADVSYVGSEGGQVEVTIRRDGTSASGMSVAYFTTAGTATAGTDYLAAGGIVEFAVGETEKTIQIALPEDGEGEQPENFLVHLDTPRPLGNSALGVPESAVITIIDNERSFYAQREKITVFENAGQTSVVVVRGGASDTAASLTYSLSDGSAGAGEDYVTATGEIVFEIGESTKAVPIQLLDDLEPESEESFTLTLSNPSSGYALISPQLVQVEILDDDRPGALVPYVSEPGAVNDIVYAVKARPNGKLLIGGRFSQINGKQQSGIAQLRADGSFDPAFDPGIGVNGTVLALDLLSDGRAVIAGDFGAVNGVGRGNIALLHVDGSLDESFDPGAGADNWIRGVTVDAEDRIMIGGFFGAYDGVTRNFVARVNTDGSLDGTFLANPGPNSAVRSLAVDANGRIVIGGDFTQVNGVTRQFYARLNSNGTVDSSFNPLFGADQRVRAVAVQTDGKIVLGGHFNSVDGAPASRVARLNANGLLDAGFNTAQGPNDNVHGLVPVPGDGGVIIAGDFATVDGVGRNRIAKLLSDGSLDPVFDPGQGANRLVWSVDTDAAGRVHLGGEFSQVNGEERLRVATLRVTANQGVFEPVISPLASGDVTGGQVRVVFSARPGTGYALEYASEVTGPWGAVITNTATTEMMELLDTNPAPDRRYYRIRETKGSVP